MDLELLSLTYFLPKDGFIVDITVNVNNRDLSNLNLSGTYFQFIIQEVLLTKIDIHILIIKMKMTM